MLRKSLISLLVISLYIGSCYIIYSEENKEDKKIEVSNISSTVNTSNKTSYLNNKEKEKTIATLYIDKINLTKDIYDINSTHNNVEENVTILNDDKDLIVLAAHSGPGSIAYFDDLDKLVLNDKVVLTKDNKKTNYKVIKIEEQPKDGTIEINKTNKERLILTTCSKKDKGKQLVIITEKIDA